MDTRQYCTICGKRIGATVQNTQTFQDGSASYTITYYTASFTEPACLGHDTPVKIPQAFYDAFSDEEVAL